jgi:NADH-quinone oxidoreductase subunit I
MTNNFELAAFSRDDLFKDREWLDNNNKLVRQDNISQLPKGKAGAAKE